MARKTDEIKYLKILILAITSIAYKYGLASILKSELHEEIEYIRTSEDLPMLLTLL